MHDLSALPSPPFLRPPISSPYRALNKWSLRVRVPSLPFQGQNGIGSDGMDVILLALLVVVAMAAVAGVYYLVARLAMRPRTRPCPRCGSQVREGILDCPECGFDFRSEWSA